MLPPTSASGALAYGVGFATAGALVGGYLGARMSPPDAASTKPALPNRAIGAAEGGIVGLLAASVVSTACGLRKPAWRSAAAATTLLSGGALLTAIGVLTVRSRKALAASVAPNALQPPGKLVTITPMDAGTPASAKVGDSISVNLPVAPSGTDWFYKGPVTGLTYKGRSGTTATSEVDSWTASAAGTVTATLQALPVDASGNPVSGAAASQTFSFTVSVT